MATLNAVLIYFLEHAIVFLIYWFVQLAFNTDERGSAGEL